MLVFPSSQEWFEKRGKEQWLVCSVFSECGRREGKRSSSLQWKGNEDVRQIKDASAERLPKLFNLRGSQKQGGCQLAAND